MLVLSRKADQKIMIGDDITLTVVRVEGNRVRIGVSAPREVRILRGELAAQDAATAEVEYELTERDFAFAHQNATDKIAVEKSRVLHATEPQVFSGTVSSDGTKVSLTDAITKPAPLAGFVSAS